MGYVVLRNGGRSRLGPIMLRRAAMSQLGLPRIERVLDVLAFNHFRFTISPFHRFTISLFHYFTTSPPYWHLTDICCLVSGHPTYSIWCLALFEAEIRLGSHPPLYHCIVPSYRSTGLVHLGGKYLIQPP